MKGKYPRILTDKKLGKQATELFSDAQKMVQTFIDSPEIKAQGVLGIFAANSINADDVEIYSHDQPDQVMAVLPGLRQQSPLPSDKANMSLADFIAPSSTELKDYIGCFAVTAGLGLEQLINKFDEANDTYSSIMAKAIGDRFAEAFAEYLHHEVRVNYWGYASDEALDQNELIAQKYRGIRPASGYPACPDHTQKTILWELLDVEKHTGISLTESLAMWPASSVSGWYFSHPESRYFGVGKIGKDQISDYASRRGIEVQVAEKWLATSLAYEPDETKLTETA